MWNSLYKNNPALELNVIREGPDLQNFKKNVQSKN